jgi:hypothetical protein
MNEDTKAKWEYLLLRLLYMVLFWFLSRLAWIVVGVLTLIQWVYVAIRGNKQSNLLAVSFSTVEYARQCGAYLTFQNDYKPFPFNDWPVQPDDTASM